MFKATVIVKRRPLILDPQGKAVEQGANQLGFTNISKTRIDKHIEFIVNVNDRKSAENEVIEYSTRLLSNPIMEDFEYTLEEVK